MNFPHVFKNAEGVELIAVNEIQASIMEREGFKPTGDYVEKKSKKTEE